MTFATLHDVAAVRVYAETTLPAQKEISRWMLELAARQRNGVGMLVWINANAPLPTKEIRDELQSMFARCDARLRAHVHVVDGTAFRAAGVRAVLLGLNVFSRKAHPTQVCQSLGDAIAWLWKVMPPNDARGDVRGAQTAFEGALRR